MKFVQRLSGLRLLVIVLAVLVIVGANGPCVLISHTDEGYRFVLGVQWEPTIHTYESSFPVAALLSRILILQLLLLLFKRRLPDFLAVLQSAAAVMCLLSLDIWIPVMAPIGCGGYSGAYTWLGYAMTGVAVVNCVLTALIFALNVRRQRNCGAENASDENGPEGYAMGLQIVRGDITRVPCDAIVNAAKPSLLGGGGVDGAIHKAAGLGLLLECMKLGGCKVGQAKITGGHKLPCKYVIHTVGPKWKGGSQGEKERLASCYRESLLLAKAYGCRVVAFPLISAEVYGYPEDQVIQVAAQTINEFLEREDMLVYLVIYT